jgi:hypothetical protein
VLIDSTHKSWIVVTLLLGVLATGLFVWADRSLPRGVTGNSVVGMVFGIAGSLLILFAVALYFVRWFESWRWVPPRKSWLRGHIWFGLLSGLLILFHSGFKLGGLLTQVLWVVLGLVLVTGLLGLVLQNILPRRLTRQVSCEVPYEQIPHVCAVLRGKAENIYEDLRKAHAMTMTSMNIALEDLSASDELQDFYEKQLWPFLRQSYPRTSPLADPLRARQTFAGMLAWPGVRARPDAVAQLETICAERRQLAEEERLHRWLHGWLLVHVPLSFVLVILAAAHAFFAVYY